MNTTTNATIARIAPLALTKRLTAAVGRETAAQALQGDVWMDLALRAENEKPADVLTAWKTRGIVSASANTGIVSQVKNALALYRALKSVPEGREGEAFHACKWASQNVNGVSKRIETVSALATPVGSVTYLALLKSHFKTGGNRTGADRKTPKVAPKVPGVTHAQALALVQAWLKSVDADSSEETVDAVQALADLALTALETAGR